jgi:hypothetical protein
VFYDEETAHADKERGLLFHYTDANGLLGIVDHPRFPNGYDRINRLDFSRVVQFKASDVRFMNDREELRFAGRVFAQQFRQAAKERAVQPPSTSARIEIPDAAAAELIQLADEFEREEFYGEPVQVFAVCVSREGDLLSQWRGYAGGTGGYAIGFSRAVLEHHTKTTPPGGTHNDDGTEAANVVLGHIPGSTTFHDVVYSDEEIRTLADQAIADHVRHRSRPDTKHQGGSLFDLRWTVVPQLARFKNPGFAEERESRILAVVSGMPYQGLPVAHAEFRPGRRAGLLPYWSFAVNLKLGFRPPPWGDRPDTTIERLVVGPGPEQHLRASAARQLLITNGHDPDVVMMSRLPFTG